METEIGKKASLQTIPIWNHGTYAQIITDCIKCESSNPTISSMHSSVSDTTQNMIKKTKKTNTLAQEIEYMHAARLFDGAEQLVKMIGPIMETTFKTSMKKPSINSI